MEINWSEFLLEFRYACYCGTVTGKSAPGLRLVEHRPVRYRDEEKRSEARSLAIFDIANGIPLSVGMGWKKGVVIKC